MLVSKSGQVVGAEDMMVVDDAHRTIWWRGLLFIPGIPAGQPSLQRFAELIDQQGLPSACDALGGNFSCIVLDKKTASYHAFSDNNRTSNLYYCDDYLSTSFLQLLKICRPSLSDLAPASVMAFMLTGQLYSACAFFHSIRFLQADEILQVSQNYIHLAKKNLSSIYDQCITRAELFHHLEEIIQSLQGENISLDLSGGSDTRLLAGLLHQLGLDFELATDCAPGFPDHDIALQAAAILQKPHFVTWQTVHNDSVQLELEETFLRADGVSDLIAYHPIYQNYAKREARGITVIISGFAGEMYKDGGWWRVAMKTLLTPNWKRAIIKKLTFSGLVGWGYDPYPPLHLFAGAYNLAARNFSASVYDQLMKHFTGKNRAELGDKIFNEFSIRTPRILQQKGLTYFPIMLDARVLPFGLHLPFGRRLFATEYRRLLYQADKKLARLQTTKAGTSLSPEPIYLAKDMLKFIGHAFTTKVLKKKKKYPLNPLYAMIRKQAETQQFMEQLKKVGVLAADVSLDAVPDPYLGRLYTLARVLNGINH